MEVNFNKKQLVDIATVVRMYKEMYVTTKGTMFRNERDAVNAIRTENIVIGDPLQYIGYVKLVEGDFTQENLIKYRNNIGLFNALFKKPTIPLQKAATQNEQARSYEKPNPKLHEETVQIAKLLGADEKDEKPPVTSPNTKK